MKTTIGNRKGKNREIVTNKVNQVKYPEMEMLLETCIIAQRSKGIAIVGNHIKKKAKEIV